jgi:hypothetical protein
MLHELAPNDINDSSNPIKYGVTTYTVKCLSATLDTRMPHANQNEISYRFSEGTSRQLRTKSWHNHFINGRDFKNKDRSAQDIVSALVLFLSWIHLNLHGMVKLFEELDCSHSPYMHKRFHSCL